MRKEKQIEEMAVILTDGGCKECNCDNDGRFNCLPMYEAELLYNAGYRKSTDVVREIFEEIEEALILSKCYGDSGVYFERDIETDIAELKKKYTGEL